MAKLILSIGLEDHVAGPENAPVTLVEYGDFECPYCGRAFYVVKDIQKLFAGNLRFVYRHFPLTEIHPHAEAAAEAAEAAGAEGKFWQMHDLLFENQDSLDDLALMDYARTLELDLGDFANALDEHLYWPKIERDFWSGVRSGVNGTPTFFINGKRHDNSFELPVLAKALQHAMEQKKYV